MPRALLFIRLPGGDESKNSAVLAAESYIYQEMPRALLFIRLPGGDESKNSAVLVAESYIEYMVYIYRYLYGNRE